MTVTVKHPFVSTVPDSADTSLVRPSNWNADHTIVGLGSAAELNAGVANGVATLDGGGTVPLSQIPASIQGTLSYQGTWNASTNTPTLASGVGTKGYYYVVSVAGSTNLDGITDWNVGDMAVYSGTAWQQIDNTDAVTSVNGYTGTVVLNAADVGAVGAITSSDGSIDVTTVGTNVDLTVSAASPASTLLGQVRNETGATLTKGTVIYISGAAGNKALVSKAIATSDATSAQTYGVVTADILNNQNGYATLVGTLTGLDTSAFAEGAQLYLSSTTAGAYTATKQYAPAHLVYVAIVTRSHVNQGSIEVKIQNGYEMDELHNVSAQTPSNGNVLIWNNSTQLWESAGITAGTGVSVTNGAGSITVANTGVTSFSAGTTGLTPSTGTTGAVTLAGTLGVANGGTGLTSVTANRIPYGNGTSALQTSANLTYNSTDLTLLSGDIYATNPTSAPAASFSAGKFLYSVGQIWNSGLGTKSMTGGFQVTSYQTNTNPTVSKLSFVVGTDSAAATEKMYVTSTGLFNINGGATFAGTTLNDTFNAVYIQNNAAATAGAAQASNKLFLQGRSWNAAAGNILTNGYLQSVTITNNANPTVESLNFAPASGSATAATQYFAMTSQGRFGVGTTTPTQTLDVTNTAGARQFTVASIASSVNYLQISGAITTNAPTINAQGSDTNIDVQIVPKGAGGLRFAGPLLPNNLAGTSGQVLTSAGAGAVPTWTTPAGSNITAQGLYENAATISANYTIGTGNNAISAGPITIASGVVVTVPSGSTWTVV